jgi:hypothetical protein
LSGEDWRLIASCGITMRSGRPVTRGFLAGQVARREDRLDLAAAAPI